jgi:hypothetical protein
MNDLFCTPEQGKRLKELLPELTSEYYWIFDVDCIIGSYPFDKDHLSNGAQRIPALTLQELRDIATITDMMEVTPTATYGWPEMTAVMDAPELADWVIERLEEQP